MAAGDRIGIADKETLDKTKNNTDDILNKVSSGVGGIDWSKYTPLNSTINIKNSSMEKKEEKILVNLTGKGYITNILLGCSGYDDKHIYEMDIIKDEIILDKTYIDAPGNGYMHLPEKCSGITYNELEYNSFSTKEYTKKRVGIYIPIFFNQSLKIVLRKCDSNTGNVQLRFTGGVKLD